MDREKLAEIGKKVAQLLAENQVTYTEVPCVFRAAERYLGISFRDE